MVIVVGTIPINQLYEGHSLHFELHTVRDVRVLRLRRVAPLPRDGGPAQAARVRGAQPVAIRLLRRPNPDRPLQSIEPLVGPIQIGHCRATPREAEVRVCGLRL